MRRVRTLGIVGFWAVMIALLVRKQAPPPTLEAALPPGTIAEHDEWFTVQHDGQRVGWAHRVTARLPAGQRFTEELAIALKMLGAPQRVRTWLEGETDGEAALRRFRFTLVSPAASFSAIGTSDGRQLSVKYGAEGAMKDVVLPLDEPIQLPSMVRPRVLAGDLAPGTRYTMPVLNPLTLRSEPLTVLVEGHERVTAPEGPIEATILAEEHQGLRARVWLAKDGGVLREEGSLGFTLVRAAREEALASGDGAVASVDLTETSRIPLVGRIDEPRTAARLTLRVRGEAAGRVPADPPRQRLQGDLLSITREPVPEHAPLGRVPDAVAGWVTATPFIEADDPGIVTTARAIVGGKRDATAAARALLAWVNDNVDQVPTVSVPSAREVLALRRGDCNEYAVLLAALARAAGIPARVVAGVMYQDGAFYYHAWNELWLGAWVSADAIFRQLPADATHVKLLEGGPERHVELASLIGRLGFTVEEGTP
jgi:Transglutaminase-like superfamily